MLKNQFDKHVQKKNVNLKKKKNWLKKEDWKLRKKLKNYA